MDLSKGVIAFEVLVDDRSGSKTQRIDPGAGVLGLVMGPCEHIQARLHRHRNALQGLPVIFTTVN